MNPTQVIKALGNSGGDWVLYLLLYISIYSVTLILERVAYFWFNREPASRLIGDGVAALARGDFGAAAQDTRGPVGRMFKVTRERVRQIEAKAVRKLQHPIRARKLEGFLESAFAAVK